MIEDTSVDSEIKQQYALLVDPHTGQEFNLCRYATTVGRSISCDVILTDKSVSRQHIIVHCLKGKFFVEDVGSTNGTMLNGKALTTRSELRAGDELKMGITRLVFLLIPNRGGVDNSPLSQVATVLPHDDRIHSGANFSAIS